MTLSVIFELHEDDGWYENKSLQAWFQDPDECKLAIMRKNGSLKHSNAGEW